MNKSNNKVITGKHWENMLNHSQFESTKIIGGKQWQKAKEMLDTLELHVEVRGGLATSHQWLDMSRLKVPLRKGLVGLTCPPALGYAFAAGTSDGPGVNTFRSESDKTYQVIYCSYDFK